MTININRNIRVNLQQTQKTKPTDSKQETKETPKSQEKSDSIKLPAENLASSKQVLEFLEAQAQLQANQTTDRKKTRESLKEQSNDDKDAGGETNETVNNTINTDHFGSGGGYSDLNNNNSKNDLLGTHTDLYTLNIKNNFNVKLVAINTPKPSGGSNTSAGIGFEWNL